MKRKRGLPGAPSVGTAAPSSHVSRVVLIRLAPHNVAMSTRDSEPGAADRTDAASPLPDPSQSRGPDKLLAIGAYGETVAAYRYLVLAEKASREDHRRAFADMADEEQGHKQRLQKLLAERYPQADFVLTPEDKELVVTGPRVIDVRNEASIAAAMRMILDTERKTAAFYAEHARHLPTAALRALFRELAEEGAEHYQRLREIDRDLGMSDS